MTRLVLLLLAVCVLAHGCPKIFERSSWSTKKTNCKSELKTPVPWVIVHHTDTPTCDTKESCTARVRSIHDHHTRSRNYCDIGYNFIIGNDGTIFEGRGWRKLGAHAAGSNSQSIGISFIGNFLNSLPSSDALNAAKSLIRCGVDLKKIKQNYTLKGHRDVLSTTCPGDALYKNLQQWGRKHQCFHLPFGQGCPTIVTRRQWGGKNPTCRSNLRTPVPNVIIHHTEGAFCNSRTTCSAQVRNIQNYHMKTRGWCDIGYNFLIGEDGLVYEGRGWTTLGAHATSYNPISTGISFIGSFTNRAPNSAALNAARSLIACAVSKNLIKGSYALKGHRNVMSTSCPGNSLYRVIQGWPHFKA
ncbi:peptidoglycan recognition protein 3-like [Ranitomeya imitator]|uniref:peptidoglycan recognition protein 3-like n=1 Tax=Ranitomeya imitator TaxID=111125 RepID=UPI0037E83046